MLDVRNIKSHGEMMLMSLKDAQVGDRILIPLNSNGSLTFSFDTSKMSIPATVVAQSPGATILAWKAGEQVPVDMYHSFGTHLCADWAEQGFVIAYRYGNHCPCQPIDFLMCSAGPAEKPCKQCGRNNDIGVSKCWMCEVSSPHVQ